MAITLRAIPILSDNYVWILIDDETKQAVIVDPGEAKPVLNYLQNENLSLIGILITHHHWDHTNGIEEIKRHFDVPIVGPKNDNIDALTKTVSDNDVVSFNSFPLQFKVFAIGGHTLGHIAYLADQYLFCGDTLFAAGCGRIFEGTAQEMYDSLQKLKSLPDDTKVCCAHEYTLNNLRFAETVEPSNTFIKTKKEFAQKCRECNLPTLPSTILEEKNTNPFLRCHYPEIIDNVSRNCNVMLDNELQVFTELRKWKDRF